MKQLITTISIITLLYAVPISVFGQSIFSGWLAKTYSVVKVTQMSSRDIEEMGVFYIEGKLSGSMNVGFTNCFKLRDLEYEKYSVLVTTERNTIPGSNGDAIKLKVKLHKEFGIGSAREILLKEVE